MRRSSLRRLLSAAGISPGRPTRRAFAGVAASVEVAEPRRMLSASSSDIRSFDGTGNNLADPQLGSTDEHLGRIVEAQYADGVHAPDDAGLPSARDVSNAIAAQSESITNDRFLTDYVWMWGQFIDHDLDLSGESHDAYDIPVSADDATFDPFGTGQVTLPLHRSHAEPDADGVMQQTNLITAFLDGSAVYGSDATRAAALRTFEGGRLKTSGDGLLPLNTGGLTNAGGDDNPNLFLAGDVRANENVGLISMHTLFVREHNRLADLLTRNRPGWPDEKVYQWARERVTAQMQAITYNEFLPALLGTQAPGSYKGYDPDADPTILNEFSTAAYRMGHSLLSPTVQRVGADWREAEEGHLQLRDAFFRPDRVMAHGIDSTLRGASVGLAQELDTQVIDDVRNFLFGPPGAGGLDLAALNIQRGRDHGLGSYNQTRGALGMRPAEDFGDISTDPAVQLRLEEAYGTVDAVELWPGLLAEDHVANSSMGETMGRIVADQFDRVRNADRFWYENRFRGATLENLQKTTLKSVIERNTGVTDLQKNVFFDRGVVNVHLPTHGAAPKVRVTVTERHVIVRDMVSGDALEVRAVDDAKQVRIIGSDRLGDRVTVDLRRAASRLAGGIVFDGGEGDRRRDELVMLGDIGHDRVRMKDQFLTCNGHKVEWSGLERVDLQSFTRPDDVRVDHNVGVEVLMADKRHDPPGGGGDDDRFGPFS